MMYYLFQTDCTASNITLSSVNATVTPGTATCDFIPVSTNTCEYKSALDSFLHTAIAVFHTGEGWQVTRQMLVFSTRIFPPSRLTVTATSICKQAGLGLI